MEGHVTNPLKQQYQARGMGLPSLAAPRGPLAHIIFIGIIEVARTSGPCAPGAAALQLSVQLRVLCAAAGVCLPAEALHLRKLQ